MNLKLYLHILQLEGYEWKRLLTWIFGHFFVRKLANKKPLVWTSKASWLYWLSLAWTVILVTLFYAMAGFGVIFILATIAIVLYPVTQLLMALATIKPYEVWNKARTIAKTREKVGSMTNLQVIGVTGSYGKTSVKEFLYQILKTQYKVLRTPESYNTVFGIARVVDLELDEGFDFFICEMGAYQEGEIAQLCRMVEPKYGILTGIAEQHLERFGSLDKIISGKFELIESLPADGFAALNVDSKNVHDNLKKVAVPYWVYGQITDAQIRIDKMKVSEEGSKFLLVTPHGKIQLQTRLVGKSNIQNIAGAVAMALYLGVSVVKVHKSVRALEPVPNRFELIKRSEMTIINDSFNSNPEGFREAVETARLFKSKFKVLITPGIVDLGSKSSEIHKKLGKTAAEVFDQVILVQNSVRTRSLEEGLLSAKFAKGKIVFVSSLNDAMQILREGVRPGSLILLENDLPDNY